MSRLRLVVYILLAFVPLSIILYLVHAPPTFLFWSSIMAIVPLSRYIGEATSELEKTSGPAVGALLNASFGNSAELIIALLAINAGLISLVKASLTGSILANILLIFGTSILFGSMKHKDQTFNKENAGLQSSMLFIALIGLAIPTIFFLATHNFVETRFLSDAVAFLLIAVYVLSLLFTLVSHKRLFSAIGTNDAGVSRQPAWSRTKSILVLFVTMAAVAVVSEILVSSVEYAATTMNWSEMFLGAVIVAVIGNAAEHTSAISFALRNDLNLSMGITSTSSIQIALFVVPVLVFAGILLRKPVTLVFSIFELVAIFAACVGANLISATGRSNWFQGAQLLSMYVILAAAFYYL